LAEATSDTKLIQDYEAVRRREYELITGLLDLLPRVDNIGEQRVNQVRDAMFHADHPYLMVLVGPFSSGKSSMINALLGADDFLKIGPVPTTDRISILRWGDVPQNTAGAGGTDTLFYPSALLRKVSLVDTPGLESVFKQHEQTTRQFLHRADVVLLVMLATQAMTQSNLETLKIFKEYGKKVILVINQSDLLSAEERTSVRDYVAEQSKDKLGYQPEIWMVSARIGIEARANGGFDQQLWQDSGLWQIEQFIEKQLQDVDRLRQKLHTPLQIVQTVHKGALEAVRNNQATFDRYRSITDNITQQLAAQKREQEKIVREINSEVEAKFRETGDRSREAIADIFRLSRAMSSLGRGLSELTGIARLLRRADAPSYVEAIFKRYKVFEPIVDIPAVVDKLPPRLEGQDMQDIDDLVRYGSKEIQNLPPEMREKIIGTVQAPTRYDRSFLQNVRADLADIEQEARTVETEKLENIRRNTLFYLAVWELFITILIVGLFNTWDLVNAWSDMPLALVLLIVLLAAAILGFVVLPLRGRIIHTEYVNRLLKLQAKYTQVLTTAADKQIEYGMQLRREAIAPVTRLIEAQAHIQDDQLARLRQAESEIASIESALNTLGKRKILGMTM
jgi:GTP-binding protein EngB required for normal cell division